MRPARSLARSNAEREAVIAYAEKRLVLYKARGCGEAAQVFGVFIADLDAELHIREGEEREKVLHDVFAHGTGAFNLDKDGAVQHVPLSAISPLEGQHAAQRQSDEYFCAKCGKRWAVSDDAPEACA